MEKPTECCIEVISFVQAQREKKKKEGGEYTDIR